jgi:serine/threonine-protein kinase
VIGQKINNYEIRAELGQGGMGTVYLAEHPVLGRRAAIKVLKREFAGNETLVSRFTNEARAASAIHHPGIIEVFDIGTLEHGVPYLMMELLEGETLSHRLARGRLPIGEAIDVGCAAAAALSAAHAHGIVHRDLKPDNLFLVADARWPHGWRLKILDFGIAKLHANLAGAAVHTHTGSVMGTPLYMSPEQCRGISSEIDHRTDVYSLGVIIYEMLTGAPPFLSEGYGDLLIMHLTQAPRPLREIDPSIPLAVEAAVMRALEKSSQNRFATVDEVIRALAGSAARIPVHGGDTALLPAGAGLALAPSKTPTGPRTTFSATTGEVAAAGAQPRRARWPRFVLAGSVGIAAAAVALLALQSRVGPARPPALSFPAPALQAPPPLPVPAPADPAAAPSAPPPAAPVVEVEPPVAPVVEKQPPVRGKGSRRRASTPKRGVAAAALETPASAEPAPTPAPVPGAPVATPPPAKPRINAEKW